MSSAEETQRRRWRPRRVVDRTKTAWVVAVVLALAPAAAGSRGVVYGINDDALRRHWAANSDRIASLGIDQVGVWAMTDCRGFVPDLGQIPANQPTLVQLLGDGSLGSLCLTRSGREAYARAARTLVQRHPNIREIQVWNEEDLCWWPCYSAEHQPRFQGWFLDKYLDLLAVTHAALAGSGVKVLGFGLSPRIDAKWAPEAIAGAVRRWYRATRWRAPLMDGFAWHPYHLAEPNTTNRIVRAFDRAWADRRVGRRWIRFPQPSPRDGLRIWWTETGFDTGAIAGPHGYVGIEGGIASDAHGSEAQQAVRVALIGRLAQKSPYVAGSFNFLLRDERDLGGWQSGLYRPDGSSKPALDSYRAAIAEAHSAAETAADEGRDAAP